ncbi:MAG: bifunctional pyr operon transcriptional regulator/uracil phosphoribosyltransferase PyrR [Candidatus Hydrogenedentes bacterium]|nr:bifunctional pyr operon transcriptional regulator/uracil phosphoribosyltransferase PyrR [Candidatus Hydrogenedentota bacterium]
MTTTGQENSEFGESTVVLDGEAMNAAIHRMAQEIVAANDDLASVVLLGILSRGRPLAERLVSEIRNMTGVAPKVGSLSTELYRDDVRSGKRSASLGHMTHFDFDVEGTTVVLVDDVLSTGRTVRAAMDEIIDYGRPRYIRLACLIDRGLRELPIQADYLGWSLVTQPDDHVFVRLKESDGEDIVLLESRPGETAESQE